MRRAIVAGFLILVAFVLWRVQTSGLNFDLDGMPGAAREKGATSLSAGAGAENELRIEIVETASEAEAHYREIVARYGDDPEAQAWIANCVAQADARQDQHEFTLSWEYACWRSWADGQDSSPR